MFKIIIHSVQKKHSKFKYSNFKREKKPKRKKWRLCLEFYFDNKEKKHAMSYQKLREEGIKRKIIIDPKSTCMDCWVFLLSQSPRRRADVNTTNHSQIRFSQSMVRERIQRGNYWDNKGKVSIAQRHNRQSICIP